MLNIAYHPVYTHRLPEGHRFPMQKYKLLAEQLLDKRICAEENFFESKIPDEKFILAAHEEDYFQRFVDLDLSKADNRTIGFPLTEDLIYREIKIAGGTIKASNLALKNGIAMNIAGGTHHAYSNRPGAFCMLNDQAIGAHYVQHKKAAKKILMIDLDVHQGDGTAEIFRDDPSVFTFSMHSHNNYPFKKEKSDLDIALPDGAGDKKYLQTLKDILPAIIDRFTPDFIFYLSGVDILSTDKLGKLNCSIQGCHERDRFVLQTCSDAQIPVECSMGGGYSEDINMIVQAHMNTYRLAQSIFFE